MDVVFLLNWMPKFRKACCVALATSALSGVYLAYMQSHRPFVFRIAVHAFVIVG